MKLGVGGRRKSSAPLTKRAGAPCAVDEALEDAPSILVLAVTCLFDPNRACCSLVVVLAQAPEFPATDEAVGGDDQG